MAPSRRRGVAKASSAAAAAATRRQWKVGDLVLAKVKGFPAWPATVSEPAKWGYSTDWKKVLVYFFGTKQIAFCNPGDVEAFTEEKKKSLLTKRQGKGADFVRAVQEIIDCYENSRVHGQNDEECSGQEDTVSNAEYFEASVDKSSSKFQVQSPVLLQNSRLESLCASSDNHLEVTAALEIADLRDMGKSSEPVQNLSSVNHLNEMSLGANSFLSNRSGDTLFQSFVRHKRVRRSRSTSKADRSSHHHLDVSAAREIADVCDADRTPETPAENVSSVDHVKETTLATTNSLRKGSGDILLQSIVGQKRVRRSRSTSKADPSRLQSHLLPLTGSNTDNGNLIPCFVREEFTKGIKETKISPESSVWHDAMSPGYSAAFVSCGSCEDNESEIVLTNSERISFNKGNMIESSFKSAGPNTMVDYSERDVQLSDRLHFQDEAVVLKKKRKPTRKRVAHDVTVMTSSPNKEAGCDAPASKIISNSPDGCEKVHEQSSRADGDEHLPLVKRARVRMGKPPPEDTQLIDIGGTEEKFLQNSLMNRTQKVSSSDCANSSGSALEVKEDVVVSSPQNCSNHTENEPSFWKAKKYQLHGLVDGEAALPPSKRLHRALEAMSANAIEYDQTYIESCETAQDLSSSGCSVSSEKSLSHTSVDEKVTIVLDVEDVNSLGGNGACMDSANGYAPDLTSPTTVVETMTYSEVKSSGHTVECSIIPEHENVDEVVISNTSLVDVKNVQVLSGSVSFVQAATNTRSPQSNTEKKQGANESPLGSFNQASPFEKEDKYDILIQSNETTENIVKVECDYSQVNKSGQEHIATQPNSQGLDPVAEEDIGTGNSLPVAIGDSCKSTESLMPPPGKNFNDLCDVVKETKHKVEDKDIDAPSYSSSMKVLIAAAQAKRNLCRSTSLSDNVLLDKAVYNTVASPSLGCRIDSYEKISPNSSISRVLAGEKMNYLLHNGSASPDVCKKTTHLELEEGNSGSLFSHKKFSGRCTNAEANAAQRSFESMLGTLTRTKESISRATRLAIDCAKYGIATEVLEILARALERESSLHKKVDLFFLVDSITQYSRSHKGDVGAIYLSVVQSMLPRLLSAAAPPGNTARENRKQCLKVLRLWLERKTLPESIVRHHMRQLDSITDVSFSGARSRRPSRMERALNDPIREMEGMLVDEYGSNASFHLPGLSMPRMLEDDEGSDADERNFEAVTPERDPQTPNEQEAAPPPAVEKHCHILEDVDGELEMEDVAPSYEGERTSAYHTAGVDTMHTLHCNVEQPTPLPFAPPLPEDHPPSPPPLPSSPPPMPPPLPSTAVPPTSSAVCHPFTECADSNHYTTSHQPGPVVKSMMLDTVQSYTLGYRDFVKQTPRSTSSSSSGLSCSFPIPQSAIQSSNTVQRVEGSTMRNQSCYVQPPPPTLSNQFSYVQADQQRQSWMHTSSSSLSKTFPFGHDLHRENRYDSRDIIEQAPYEIGDKCKIAAPVHSGAVHSDNPEAFVSVSHYAPPNDSRILNRGWSFPPRAINYRHPTPSRPPECAVAGPNGAPNFWIPR